MDNPKQYVTDQLVNTHGWTPAQAQGIVANLQMESSLNPAAVGDNGNAYGIAQWQGPRQKDFAEKYGKPIQTANLDEQIAFVNHELRSGKEMAAGHSLSKALTAGDAAEIVSRQYERPARADFDAARRRALADGSVAPTPGGSTMPQQGAVAAPGSTSDWPRLPIPQKPGEGLYGALIDSLNAQAAPLKSTAIPDAQTARSEAADVADTQAKEGHGFFTAFASALGDPRTMATWALVDGYERSQQKLDANADPGYFQANRDKILAGTDGYDREYLEANVRGPETLQASLTELAKRKITDKEYGLSGGGSAFFANLTAGVFDPATYVAGAVVGKGANILRIGHAALAAKGSVGAARVAFLGEMAGTNMALEGVQQTMGEVKTSSDYAMAAGMGAIMGLPFARGAVNGAVHNHIRELADDINVRATAEQADRVAAVLKEDPTMAQDPARAARVVEAREVADVQQHIRENSTPSPFRDRAVPDSVESGQRAEWENAAEIPTAGDAAKAEATAAEMAESRVPKQEVPAEATPEERAAAVKEHETAVADAHPKNDVDATAKTDPSVRQTAGEPEPLTFPKLEDLADREGSVAGVEGSRDIPTRTGGSIRVKWNTVGRRTEGTHASVRETLSAMLDQPNLSPQAEALAHYLLKVGRDDVLDGVGIRFLESSHPEVKGQGGFFRPSDQHIGVKVHSPDDAGGLKTFLRHGSLFHYETVLHEVTHAMLAGKVQAHLEGRIPKGGELGQVFAGLEDLFARYKAKVATLPKEMPIAGAELFNGSPKGVRDARGPINYGTQNLHEFTSQVMGNEDTRAVLRSMEGKPVFGKPTTAWQELMGSFRRILGIKPEASKVTGETEGLGLLDRLISLDGSNIRYQGGEPTLFAPAMNVGTKQRSRAQDIMQHARAWVASNPIDRARVAVGTWGGARSDGLVLAGSKNPILNMFAGIVAETTTGAAGRKATVAIRSSTMHAKILGNAILDHQSAFERYRQARAISGIKEAINGDGERAFNKEVYTEITKRRDPQYQSQGADANVVAAADSLEKLFQRAADDQRAAGVLGADNLPTSSRGYVPQQLDGARIQTLEAHELIGLHQEMSRQFQRNMGWDAAFADSFAPYYVDRIRQRSQGAKDAEGIAKGEGDAAELVRQTLEDMAVDPNLRNRAGAAAAQAGKPKWLNSRLSLDLSAQFAPGKTLLDVYKTDALGLARDYSHRSAGTVALTESGILGLRGIRELRQAAVSAATAGENASLTELRAFDRVVAEILGGRTGLEVSSPTARDLGSLVRLQRLGGLVFAQAAEAWNMTFALGVGSVLRGIPALGRHLSDIRTLKAGGVSGNPLLKTIEVPGGEFGMRDYKMAMPLDPGDSQLAEYMNHPGLISRLLRTGEHFQAKIVGFKALVAVQHRHVAEEIVRKSLRYINEGRESTALADMGITPELRTAIRQELPNIAVFDGSGRVTQLDMTRISDPRIAEAYGQVVHRGTAQIIQHRFAGERSAWFSNDYMQLLFQLRGFGLTAVEKQWGRAQMNYGYAKASGMLMAQLALSLPIYVAKAELVSQGMHKSQRDEFLKKALNPAQMVKGVLSYASLSGLTGDVLDTVGGLAGGWGDSKWKDTLGASPQGVSASRLVPLGGTIDSALRVASGRADLHTGLKQLPFSNIWYLQPLLNMTKKD